jgi:hypothetical protein
MHYITELLNDVNSATQDDGFEFDGVWVTDPTVSECGRFDYTKEESLNAYGISSEKYDALIAKSKIKWTDFSYSNDACNSIGFDLDGSGENYVQLFAFASQEDADAEGLDVYGITVCVNGDTSYDEWSGNDRDEAIAKASSKALEISISKLVMSKSFDDLDALCLFVQNSIGLTDGGNAAMFWSGLEDGVQELLSETKSKNVLDAIPEGILLEYVQSEILFAQL